MTSGKQTETFKDVYIYSLWKGKFLIHNGDVHVRKNYSRYVNHATFLDRTDVRSYSCNSEPGVVYNQTVWLYEKDDEKAIQLLIDYYACQIIRKRHIMISRVT